MSKFASNFIWFGIYEKLKLNDMAQVAVPEAKEVVRSLNPTPCYGVLPQIELEISPTDAQLLVTYSI